MKNTTSQFNSVPLYITLLCYLNKEYGEERFILF